MSSTFEVTGTGRFPLDMLRYDGAFPFTGADTALIEKSLRSPGLALDPYTVKLCSTRKAATERRWASFGFTVSNVARVTR